jgi:HEAT repeat protein
MVEELGTWETRERKRAEWDALTGRLRRLPLDDLLRLLYSGHEEEQSAVASVLAEAPRSADPSILDALIHAVETTESALVRNSIAIALYDLGDMAALQPLVRALRRSRDTGQPVGTIVWALSAFDPAEVVEDLAELFCGSDDPSAEIAWSATAAIEGVRSPLPPVVHKRVVEMLTGCLERAGTPEWKETLLQRALAHLDAPALGS